MQGGEGGGTAFNVESGAAARGIDAHLPDVGVAPVEMVLDDGELKGKAVHAAAVRHCC